MTVKSFDVDKPLPFLTIIFFSDKRLRKEFEEQDEKNRLMNGEILNDSDLGGIRLTRLHTLLIYRACERMKRVWVVSLSLAETSANENTTLSTKDDGTTDAKENFTFLSILQYLI